MAAPDLHKDVAERLGALEKTAESIDAQDVIDIVHSILRSMDEGATSVNLQIYAEIEQLSRYINAARAEIAELRPHDITSEHLPTATDELSAVVGATEQATNAIFEAVEAIESLTQEMPEELAERITAQVTAIYEACGFQDITGQRITKVVTALQQIEQKVGALLEAFGDDPQPAGGEKASEGSPSGRMPAAPAPGKRVDEHLINGPAKDGEAISQADIDALLGFD